MRKTTFLLWLACSLALPAWADLAISERLEVPPPSGFMIQPMLSGAAAISAPASALGSAPGNAGPLPFLFIPSLRLGYLNHSLAVLFDVTYFHSASLGDYNDVSVFTAGADVMPFVWHSVTGRARLYALGGFNLGVAFGGSSEAGTSATAGPGGQELTGGLTFGVGGDYLLRPRLSLGIELGSRTEFFRRDGGTGTLSSVYAGLSGTFATTR
jgi:hypothetical protein